MNNIKSERRGLKLGLPAGSWLDLHWTLAGGAAGAGRDQRSSQHGARQAREEVIIVGGKPGLGQGQQPQLNPDSWAMQVQY